MNSLALSLKRVTRFEGKLNKEIKQTSKFHRLKETGVNKELAIML